MDWEKWVFVAASLVIMWCLCHVLWTPFACWFWSIQLCFSVCVCVCVCVRVCLLIVHFCCYWCSYCKHVKIFKQLKVVPNRKATWNKTLQVAHFCNGLQKHISIQESCNWLLMMSISMPKVRRGHKSGQLTADFGVTVVTHACTLCRVPCLSKVMSNARPSTSETIHQSNYYQHQKYYSWF